MIKNELEPRTKLQELKDLYCDCHKDVHGIKARWVYDMDLTEAELEKMMDQLEKDYTEVREEEARIEAANEVKAREQIWMLMVHGAKDVAMAIRWMHDAEDTGNDHRYLDYTLGVRYGFIEEVLAKGL
jgi:septation ring formation regulator EzrA